MIEALYKAGLANLTDVVFSYATSKRVTVKSGRHVIVKLRGDIAGIFGFLNNTTTRASDEKGFTLTLPKTGNQYFYTFIQISLRVNIIVPILCTVTVKGEHESYVSKNFER